MSLPKAVLLAYLVTQTISGLVRVSAKADRASASEMAEVGIAATIYALIMAGLFAALGYA